MSVLLRSSGYYLFCLEPILFASTHFYYDQLISTINHYTALMVNVQYVSCVLFDMDNTLFDFVASKLEACREILSYIAKEEGNPAGDPSELFEYFLKGTHGFEDYENIRDYMEERKLYTAQRYTQCCMIYEKEKLQNLKLYPGVKETLEKLKALGLKLAIITDADRNHALARLTQVKLLDSFDVLVAADMTGTKKPDPAHFLFALQALGKGPEESLVVGDSIRKDIVPAHKLGLKTAYASYGDWRPTEEKDHCFDFKLNEFSDLLGWGVLRKLSPAPK
jgi:putative hydrolase of the HAD superfamily